MATIRDKYVLDVDTRGAQRSLANIRNAVGALAGALAIREVAQFTASIVEATTTFERYQTVLTTFLGSQEAANKELARLQKLANTLPQDLMDISEAFIILNRYGLDTTNKGLREFSNIATANGKSIEQLAEAIGDALTGEFERLKEFGIKVTKESGEVVARIGDDIVASARNTTELIGQIQNLGSTRFGGAAEANADTLNQALSNLRGAVFETQVAFGRGLKPELKEVADEMAALLRANEELAVNLGAGLGDAIRTLASAARLIIDNLDLIRTALITLLSIKAVSYFAQLAAELRTAAIGAKSASGVFSNVGKALRSAVRSIPGIGLIGTAIRALMGPVGLVVTAITGLAFVWRDVKDATVQAGAVTTTYGEIGDAALFKVIQKAKELWNWIGTQLVNAFNALTEAVAPFKKIAIDSFNAVYQTVRSTVNFMIGAFVGFFKQVTSGIKDLPMMFLQALESSLVVIKEFVFRAGGIIGELWDYVTTLGKDEITNTFSGIGDIVSAELDKIGEQSSVDWAEIMNTDYIGKAKETIVEAVEDLVTEYRAAQPAVEELTKSQDELNKKNEEGAKKVAELSKEVKAASVTIAEYIRQLEEGTKDAKFELATLNLNELEKQIARIQYDINKGLAEELRKLGEIKTASPEEEAAIKEQIKNAKEAARVAIEEQAKVAESIYEQQRSFEYGWKRAFEEYQDNATNAARAAERIFKQTTQTMEDAIVDFAKTGKFEFKGLINDILEQLLRSQIQSLIAKTFGAFNSRGGGSTLGNLFAGFFANGGTIPSGQFGVVGERGAELVSGPATVTPLSGVGGGGNVTYNINAVDASSFKSLVARDPGFIHSVAQQGARKVPGRR